MTVSAYAPATLGAWPGAEPVLARDLGDGTARVLYCTGRNGTIPIDMVAWLPRTPEPSEGYPGTHERVHPAPWWYRLALRICPSRCREVPEARDPGRVLLRQVAIVSRLVYLQGFASGEDRRWMHSHGWRYVIAIGLWGGYSERRLGRARVRRRRAPYVVLMDDATIHQVTAPLAGHTSIAIGWGRDPAADREYWPADLRGRPWPKHTRARVRQV